MSDLRLDPIKLADAQIALETVFGPTYRECQEERRGMVAGIEESKYKEEIFASERANEANFNAFVIGVRAVRENFAQVKGLAEALSKREAETTKEVAVDTNVQVADTSGVLTM